MMAITREDDFVSRAAGEWRIHPSEYLIAIIRAYNTIQIVHEYQGHYFEKKLKLTQSIHFFCTGFLKINRFHLHATFFVDHGAKYYANEIIYLSLLEKQHSRGQLRLLEVKYLTITFEVIFLVDRKYRKRKLKS
jgi:hypothetical protein